MKTIFAFGLAVSCALSLGCATSSPAHIALESGKDSMKDMKYEKARASFTKCLELDPNVAECHLGLGSVLARAHKPEEARVHYSEFLRLQPNHARAKEVQALLKDYDDGTKRQSGPPPAP